MFSKIISFFWPWSTPVIESHCELLSLDAAYDLVRPDNTAQQFPRHTNDNEVDQEILDYQTQLKIGQITKFERDFYTVDDKYEFPWSSSEGTLSIGARISYQLIRTKTGFKVIDINLLDRSNCDDWDRSNDAVQNWCVRTLICRVDAKQRRTVTLMPGQLVVDLNETLVANFVPCLGDWLEVEVKCVVDENMTDLAGKVLEVNRVGPVRRRLDTGRVSKWDQTEKFGVIDNKIYFNEMALCCGYWPVFGDHVVAESVESDQGMFSWRAVKILPDFLCPSSTKSLKTTNRLNEGDFTEHYDGMKIIENLEINLNKLGDLTLFTVHIENIGADNVELVEAYFPRTNQCKILYGGRNICLKAGTIFPLQIECTGRNIGTTKEALLFRFNGFNIRRWVVINVNSPLNVKKPPQCGTKSKSQIVPLNATDQLNVIRGQPVKTPVRFAALSIPQYTVPQKMLQLVSGQKSATDKNLVRQLETWKTCLASDLTYVNYEDRFHTLCHLDECAELVAMQTYNLERTVFIRCNDYLLLEIENLSERKPTIIVGDKIIATSIFDRLPLHFEGCVHKVGRSHVYLKFTPNFHARYKGEDYAVKVVASRMPHRKLHYGITMAVRNLGKDFLFPSKITIAARCVENNAPVPYWYNPTLNEYQRRAVQRILNSTSAPLPYVIFGPPGTGKTVTLVEGVLQIYRTINSSRILVAAPSNSAANLLATRLIRYGGFRPGDLVRLVAFTAIDSLPTDLAPYSVVGTFERPDTDVNAPQVCNNGLTVGGNSSVVGRHRITVTTCSTAGALHLMGFRRGHFSHICVDEAGQTCEPTIMIALSLLDVRTGQAILAGDPMQLGPVILSDLAVKYGLNESFLERIISRFPYARDPEGFPDTHGYDPRLVTKLIYNYRALPELIRLPSLMFYHEELIPTISETNSSEARLLKRLKSILPNVSDEKKFEKTPSFVFHGVFGSHKQAEDSPSWLNPNEAAQIFYYLNEFYRLGLCAADVGIITPYRAQSQTLIDLCKEIEFEIPKIGTVEEFQGQEYNVILLSTVRSSRISKADDGDGITGTNCVDNKNFGFVSCPRRLNVAITRAKVLLIIVGDPNLLYLNKDWRMVIDYCVKNGNYVGCEFTC